MALSSTAIRGSDALLCAHITPVIRDIDVEGCTEFGVNETGTDTTLNIFQ